MPEHEYEKIDLAVNQLETAVRLFLDRSSMVSALTLAGAAEEIMGQAVKRKGKRNAVEQSFDSQRQVLELLYRKPVDIKKYASQLNYPRNAAKHFNDPSEPKLIVDLEDAALWMIVRAYTNYRVLGLPDRKIETEFNEWFYEHVVGV